MRKKDVAHCLDDLSMANPPYCCPWHLCHLISFLLTLLSPLSANYSFFGGGIGGSTQSFSSEGDSVRDGGSLREERLSPIPSPRSRKRSFFGGDLALGADNAGENGHKVQRVNPDSQSVPLLQAMWRSDGEKRLGEAMGRSDG